MRSLVDMNGTRNSTPLSPERQRQNRRSKFMVAALLSAGLIAGAIGTLVPKGTEMDTNKPPRKPDITLSAVAACPLYASPTMRVPNTKRKPIYIEVKSITPIPGTWIVEKHDKVFRLENFVDNSGKSAISTEALMRVKSVNQKGIVLEGCNGGSKQIRLNFGARKKIEFKKDGLKTTFDVSVKQAKLPDMAIITVY